jgi:hypothetical protein
MAKLWPARRLWGRSCTTAFATEPCGTPVQVRATGTVEGLAVAPAAKAPMQLLEVVTARAGRGVVPAQDVHVPHIDLPADLNWVDDDGLNLARVPAAGVPRDRVVVSGTEAAWTWALIEDTEDGWVRFRQVTAREAGQP